MCRGTPGFEFYKGKKLVATIGFHHGQSLRRHEGWPGDATLTKKSAKALSDWLEKNGAGGDD